MNKQNPGIGWIERLNWLVIGALTDNGRAVLPEDGGTRREWVEALTIQADAAGVPVYLKSNLRHMALPDRREFPEGLKLEGDDA